MKFKGKHSPVFFPSLFPTSGFPLQSLTLCFGLGQHQDCSDYYDRDYDRDYDRNHVIASCIAASMCHSRDSQQTV